MALAATHGGKGQLPQSRLTLHLPVPLTGWGAMRRPALVFLFKPVTQLSLETSPEWGQVTVYQMWRGGQGTGRIMLAFDEF